LRKDGTRISAEFSIIMVKEKNGSVLGVAAVIRDVTSRWQRERVLKERLMALETHSQ
jgi:PAS domain S-box-containing protein